MRDGDLMRLTNEQSYELLAKHGIFAGEICDKCGTVLGAVRFTRKDESGVWCSRECRDGADAWTPGTCKGCGAALTGKRKDAKHCSDLCRKRGGSQKVLTTPTYPEIAAHSKGLASTGIGFGCPYTSGPRNSPFANERAADM